MLVIKVNWYGPFDMDHMEDAHELFMENGLYMFTGKTFRQRGDAEIKYFGITETTYKTRFAQHKRLFSEDVADKVTKDLGIWLGLIDFPLKHTRRHLETAESAFIYFLKPHLNIKKKCSLPEEAIIISNWFTKDGKARINQSNIYKGLPDVIAWDGEHWRTGNLKVYENS